MREPASAKGLELRVEVDQAIPRMLRGDPARVAHALRILVDNAIKYSDRGTVSVSASLTARPGGDALVRFEVRDQGPGIPESHQAELFTPFSQGDQGLTRRYEGLGLGLALARRLVALMGGEIGLSSRQGEGCLFHFELRFDVPEPVGNACADLPLADVEQARRLAELLLTLLEMADEGNARVLWHESMHEMSCMPGLDAQEFGAALGASDSETAVRLLRDALAHAPEGDRG